VVFLSLQGRLAHKHWEVTVVNSKSSELIVEEVLDLFPNEVSSRSKNIASRDIIVLDELRLGDDLGVPLGEVDLLLVENSELVRVSVSLGLFKFFLGLLLFSSQLLSLLSLGFVSLLNWLCICFSWT